MQIDRTLITKDRIAARVEAMGRAIAAELGAEGDRQARIVLVPVLTGAMVFVADLIRAMDVKMSVRPITVSSYPGQATSSQGANIRGELPTDLKGCHVVLVDDILDSGRTLGLLRRVILAQDPASLRLVVLLNKHKAKGRDEEVVVDHAGFDIEDEFVVGYGLDYDGYFRNLPEIVTLKDR
jgi:hypoxanthine phosphoribosyltransferase